MMTFEELGLNKNLLKRIAELGWVQPTPIQQKAIPVADAGQDIVGIAQTGTGKTAAFLLPILSKLGYQHDPCPRVIIFAPTKELAKQIGQHFEQLNTSDQLNCVTLVGGTGVRHQLELLKDGADVIVATPGRFMEIYRQGGLDLKKVKTLILDEADRLMDMGFMPQLRTLLEVIPVKRQNMLFSATYPPKVEELSYEFLEFPTKIEIEAQSTPAETVSQSYYSVNGFRTKVNLLKSFLDDKERFSKVIVFTNTKTVANELKSWVESTTSREVSLIHSNKSQTNRGVSLKSFESGEKSVLITTDVSSRGLDINEVSHVVNFEVPHVYQDYVHRIGRTGRAFKVGEAISFANKVEEMYIDRYPNPIEKKNIPSDIEQVELKRDEVIEIERAIDFIKRKENPDFKGAFHEKKKRSFQNKKGDFRKKKKKR